MQQFTLVGPLGFTLSPFNHVVGDFGCTEGHVPHSYINDYFEVENEWLIRKESKRIFTAPTPNRLLHLRTPAPARGYAATERKKSLDPRGLIQYGSKSGTVLARGFTMEDFHPHNRTND